VKCKHSLSRIDITNGRGPGRSFPPSAVGSTPTEEGTARVKITCLLFCDHQGVDTLYRHIQHPLIVHGRAVQAGLAYRPIHHSHYYHTLKPPTTSPEKSRRHVALVSHTLRPNDQIRLLI